MATLTNLDNEIFAESALEGLISTLLPFMAFSTDFSPAAAVQGVDILVPLVGSLTATTFSAYNVSGGTQSAITVSLNKHKHVPVSQTDIQRASSSRAKLENYAFQAGAGLGLLIFQDVFSLVSTGNFSLATAVSIVDFGLNQIRAARLALGNSKVPLVGRSLVLDINPFDNLLGISNFLQANLAGSTESLREARVGRAMGFDIYESNGLPGTNSVMGFVGHGNGIAIASRYLQPQRPEAYIEARPVTDPATGITMGFRRHYDTNTGIEYVNLECVYGYAVGLSNCGRVIKRLD